MTLKNNLFNAPAEKEDIRVAYIDPIYGLVRNVSICEAIKYDKKNPGTIFIFRNGDQILQYLNIKEVSELRVRSLKKTKKKEDKDDDGCVGIITSPSGVCKPPTIQIFGGGGIGAAANAVVGNDGAILAVDIVREGNGYQYAPLVSARDNCAVGSGAVLKAIIGTSTQTKERPDEKTPQECPETEVGYGRNWGPDGEDISEWDPKSYFRPSTLSSLFPVSSDDNKSPARPGPGPRPVRFEAGVFTPSNPRRIGNRTTYDLTYKLTILPETLARIEGYKPGDLVKVTWSVSGSGDIGTGYRFTFIEKNAKGDSRHRFSITEASVESRIKREVKRVKPNVNYRVIVSSDGGTVQGKPGPRVDRDDPQWGGIQKGTLKGGKLDSKQLRNTSPNTSGEKSNAVFADTVATANDSNDMRILAFSVDVPKPEQPERPPRPVIRKEERGFLKEIIVLDPGVGFPTTSSITPIGTPPIIVLPDIPGIGTFIIGFGTGGSGFGTSGFGTPGFGTFGFGGPGFGTTGPGIGTIGFGIPLITPGFGTSGFGGGFSTTGFGTFRTTPGFGTSGFGGGFTTFTGIGTIGFGIPLITPGFSTSGFGTFRPTTGFGTFRTITPSGPPTGVNATFIPQFEVIRDPIVIDRSKLLQVTDLVGLKQTGYVNGRAYYGAVYYDNGIRYAGYYETVGEPIQVYDTLRESIIAQVTTPPSAILRQGTDIRSNDPLLNIPGTVQSTLSSRSIVGAGDYFPPSIPFVQEIIQDPTYSVVLRLKSVIVVNPGINYNVTDRIRITPSNGAVLEPVFGSFGRVIKVNVIDPGFGFTEYPTIEMFTP